MPPVDKSLLNPALYSRLRTHWFGTLPPTAQLAPPPLLKKWFGFGPPSDKTAFDTSCRTAFSPALDSLNQANYPLPPTPTWSAEQAHAESIAKPLLETLTPRDGDSSSSTSSSASSEELFANDALALIILLDQIPRNIHRQSQHQIYNHYDTLSRAALHALLSLHPRPDHHPSLRTSPARRAWFYMPLMHSEHLEDHARYSALLAELRADVEAMDDAEYEGRPEGERREDVLAALDEYARFEERHVGIVRRFGRYPYRNKCLGRESTLEEREYLEGGGETFGSS